MRPPNCAARRPSMPIDAGRVLSESSKSMQNLPKTTT
jgi:hypothetical protein